MAAGQGLVTRLSEAAARAAAGPLGGMVRRARDEFLRSLPERWRARLLARPAADVLMPMERGWKLAQWRDGALRDVMVFEDWDATLAEQLLQRSQGRTLQLWVDARHALRRPMMLPSAAESRLHEVVGFEIERQTPFNTAQVAHAGRVLRREAGSVQAELVVLPLSRLQHWLRDLGPLAAAVSKVDLIDGGHALGVDLLPRALRRADGDAALRRSLVFCAIAVLLVVIALWWMRQARGEAVLEWQQRVQAAEEQVRGTRRLRNAVDAFAAEQAFLGQQSQRHPSIVRLMDDLTRRIPDDTAFDKLAVNDGRLTLVGVSRKATDVVSQLQGSELVRNAALAGAVQADPRTGRDRFTVTAVVGSGAATPSAAKPYAGPP